ncbi:MAG TPA: protein kinase, partial [Pyrinomonadaceae bacterium]|nr:protein kinase [Pyrinomonadaceae bacterium]
MDRRQRVEQLFHEALALEPSARTRFLAEACATDPGLLDEVTELISAHEQIGSFIDRPAYHGLDLDDDLSDSLIGTSLGRYRIIRLIKRSGMGEVYLARDTHLPRDVALKLLPLVFTGDENRLRRFILEAESASSLNHPNILTIYEIGHIDDVHYIATEFVDGQTLRERLSDGQLDLNEALEIAIGVSNALVASHAAGIVHRDIKPENIMIRRDGYVKVLDFGLAKLTERPDVRVNGNRRNISKIHTDPGTFMGTIGYLSPEQAKSLEVDTRSDVFSLGVVIYEMVTGQSPFNREVFSEVIVAILRTEPLPLAKFAPNAPASLQKIVTKALSKDKLDRYQQTEDLLTDLKAVQAQIQQQVVREKLRFRERWRRLAMSLVAIIAIVFLGSAILKLLNRNRSANGVSDLSARIRFSEIQSWKSERGESAIEARFSHDGQMIAFTMIKNELEGIWVKQAVSGGEPRLIIADPSENNWPIWSPSDDRIAFYSYREDKVGIWASPVNGGPPQFLGTINGRGVRLKCWSKDGRTIYYDSANNLFSFDIATGTVTQLTKFERQPSYRHFSLAPNEDRIAYVGVQNGQTDIWVASLNGDSAFKVTNDAEVDRSPLWHPDGKRIVYTSNRGGAFQVFVAYLDGTNPTQVTVSSADHVITDISRDGARLLNVSSQDNAEIFSVDTDSGREFELTSGSGLMLWPQV